MAARTACAILARSSPPCRCLSTEAADVFLYANGYDLEISEEDFEALALATAQGQLPKTEIAARLREQSRPRL